MSESLNAMELIFYLEQLFEFRLITVKAFWDQHIISEEFQKELQILRNNVSTVENMINFLKKLPEEQKNDESMKVIIENMNQLCKKS